MIPSGDLGGCRQGLLAHLHPRGPASWRVKNGVTTLRCACGEKSEVQETKAVSEPLRKWRLHQMLKNDKELYELEL